MILISNPLQPKGAPSFPDTDGFLRNLAQRLAAGLLGDVKTPGTPVAAVIIMSRWQWAPSRRT